MHCVVRRVTLFFLPVLLLAFAMLWVTTYRRSIAIDYRFGSYLAPGAPGGEAAWWTYRARTLGATSFHGRVVLRFSEYRSLAPTREELLGWSDHSGWSSRVVDGVSPGSGPLMSWNGITDFDVLGLGLTGDSRQGEESRALGLPYWFLCLGTTGLWLFLWIPYRRQTVRRARGQCPSCGYSRSGLADADPCPECGNQASSPRVAVHSA